MGIWDEPNITQTKEENVEVGVNKKIHFTKLKELPQKRGLKVGVYGEFSTGKTHFAMTASNPIFILDTEMGVAPLANIFGNKDIKVMEVYVKDEINLERDEVASFEQIKYAVDEIEKEIKKLSENETPTIVLDSATDFWSFCQAYGKVKIFKLKPEDRLKFRFDWKVINSLYQQLLVKLIYMKCNLIITARSKEDYDGPAPSGTYSAAWQKKTGFWLDVVLFNNIKKDKQTGKTIFTSEIKKCRPNGNIIGKTYENLDFNKLVEVIGGGVK